MTKKKRRTLGPDEFWTLAGCMAELRIGKTIKAHVMITKVTELGGPGEMRDVLMEVRPA